MFGGGDSERARDFVQRYEEGDPTEGYSREEATEAVQTTMRHASPETMQRAWQQSLGRLSDNQRAQFAEMLEQRRASGRRGGEATGHAASRGPVIQRSGGGGVAAGAAGGSSLEEMFGGLFGGMTGQSRSRQTGATGGGGSDLIDNLGDILSSPVGKAAMAGMAAFEMKEIMDRK